MARNSFRFVMGALILATAGFVAAQEEPRAPAPRRGGRAVGSQQSTNGDGAQKVADRAIAELVAWKTTKAKSILADAEEAYGTTNEYKAATALLLYNQGKVQQALDQLDVAATSAPSDPMSQYFNGEILQDEKEYDDAVTAWTEARDRAKAQVAANPKNARAQYYLGAALVRLKKIDQARTAIVAAADNQFDPRLCGYQLGLSHAQTKQWQAAKEAFDGVLETDPLFAPAYFYRGLTWSKLGRNDKMVEDLDQFIKLAPNSPDADTARAMLGAYAG